MLEVRDDRRAIGTGSCLSQHPFLPVLQCTETCLPSIPQSCRALPGLQVFALVVSTASKAEFAPDLMRLLSSYFSVLSPDVLSLSKVPPPQPTLKRNLHGSPFTIAPCCPVFITLLLYGMILFIYLLARWLPTLLFSSFSPFPRTMSSRQ